MIEHFGSIPLQNFLKANAINLDIFNKDYISNVYVENPAIVCDKNVSLILNKIYYNLGKFNPLNYNELIYDSFRFRPDRYIPVIYFDSDNIPYLTYLYFDDELRHNCSIISVIDLHPETQKEFNKYFLNKLKILK